MIHLFINALSASAGGGLTYIRNVVPQLAIRGDVRATVLVNDAMPVEIAESDRIALVRVAPQSNAGTRFLREQNLLPKIVRQSGANILLSPGNFALFRSPIPQILLSRNALYISTDFMHDVRERGDYRLWMDTTIKAALARWSILRAEHTIAPSEAFAAELRRWTGKDVECIHHGFDTESFFRETTPLAREMQQKLASTTGALRVLFVSHYNYYRNFETLIRAIAIVKRKLHPRKIRLILTCNFISEENPGIYRAEAAAELLRALNLEEEIVPLGAVPYRLLHHVYCSCDIYATPAYAETFAHPLVEAMASGLPVIASDLVVHREICGEAAVYFPRFSAEALAEQIVRLSECQEKKAQMSKRGMRRAQDFQWKKHVDALMRLARNLADPNS